MIFRKDVRFWYTRSYICISFMLCCFPDSKFRSKIDGYSFNRLAGLIVVSTVREHVLGTLKDVLQCRQSS